MGEYKLRMNDAIKQMQSGLGDILYDKGFLDAVIVCSNGVVHHSRLTVSLMFPEVTDSEVFNFPVQQYLLLPDHSVAEIQVLVEDLFTSDCKLPNEINENDIEIVDDAELVDDFTIESDSIYSDSDEFLGRNNSNYYEIEDKDYKSYSYGHVKQRASARGRRGRPPLGNRTMPERFRCDICDKGFYYNSMLTQHMKTHTGGVPRETCPKCGVEYATRQILKAHMIRNHGADSFVSRPRGRPPGKSRSPKLEGGGRGKRRENLKHIPNASSCGSGYEDMERIDVAEQDNLNADINMSEGSNNPLDNSNDIKETESLLNKTAFDKHIGDGDIGQE